MGIESNTSLGSIVRTHIEIIREIRSPQHPRASYVCYHLVIHLRCPQACSNEEAASASTCITEIGLIPEGLQHVSMPGLSQSLV